MQESKIRSTQYDAALTIFKRLLFKHGAKQNKEIDPCANPTVASGTQMTDSMIRSARIVLFSDVGKGVVLFCLSSTSSYAALTSNWLFIEVKLETTHFGGEL